MNKNDDNFGRIKIDNSEICTTYTRKNKYKYIETA